MVRKDKKWKLSGRAYGCVYAETMTLVEKKMVSVPDHLVEQHMSVVSKKEKDNPEYREAVSKQEQAIFKTDKGNTVVVSPRYVGSRLGSNDDGRGNTICAFIYNGEYVALADYNEEKREVIVMEY